MVKLEEMFRFALVVAYSCVLELQEAVSYYYHIQYRVDSTATDSREMNIFGLQKAKEPGQCYRRAAELYRLDARLEKRTFDD